MWFWWFWGISTVCCLVTMSIMAKAINNKLRKDGIKVFKEKNSAEFIIRLLPFSIPFLNILIVLIGILSFDNTFKKTKELVLKRNEEIENRNKK